VSEHQDGEIVAQVLQRFGLSSVRGSTTRGGMKALRGSAEEKELLRRYTRQLDEQETRLDALKQQIAQTTTTRDRLRAELSALIQTVSFELSAGS